MGLSIDAGGGSTGAGGGSTGAGGGSTDAGGGSTDAGGGSSAVKYIIILESEPQKGLGLMSLYISSMSHTHYSSFKLRHS